MATPGQQRWLLKNSYGQVSGPFTTDEVLAKISSGELYGDELVALYPGAEWIPISKDPQFYDRLLELLENDRADVRPSQATPGPSKHAWDEKNGEKSKPHGDKNQDSKNRVHRVKVVKLEPEKEPIPDKTKVIELKKRDKLVKKYRFKNIGMSAMVVLLAVAAAFYFTSTSNRWSAGRIHLLIPKTGGPLLTSAQIKVKEARAMRAFSQDTFSSYVQSEEQLVEILSGSPNDSGDVALLCLNYLELWPYAQQDSHDFFALTRAIQLASSVDPASNDTAVCRVVDFIARGRYVEAQNLTESVLDSFNGNKGQPPIAFYYLKARLLDLNNNPTAALGYVQTAEQLWPQWLGLFSYEAQILVELKKYEEAASRFQAVLKVNPNHKVAQIELGILDLRYLHDPNDGRSLLEQALSSSERAPQEILAKGYVALADWELSVGRQAQALKYAQKAYTFNSLNARAKQIILQLGGEKTLLNTHVEDLQLVYEGDQLYREGDLNSAQAHYKEAFETNPKNGVAAMKAAKCLWKLSLSSEAIDWLNKAISADPKLIDAYTLLADYYSRQFNYEAAGQVLNQAFQESPRSYKAMDGFALVELRRHDSKGAVEFAKKALELNQGDVNAYITLTKAQLDLGQYAKAFDSASHAVEIDVNSRGAQIAYADALGGARGSRAGIEYLKRLVSTYPMITEYRLALGDLYMKNQNYRSAKNVYNQVIGIGEQLKPAYMGLGRALEGQGKYEDALTAFFKAAALDPADATPLFYTGMLYLAAHKPTDAQAQFERVLKVNKNYPLVNYEIGRAALMLDAPEEALDQAKLEEAKNPKLADPYILAADAYTALKQYSLCAAEYQKAVKLRPEGAEMYVKMARCYRLAGDLGAALAMINIAHDQDSGNPEVWKEQGAIYDTRGDRQKAIAAYSEYLALAPNASDRAQVQSRINFLSR